MRATIWSANISLTAKTDARGVQTDYVYDALNRVTNRNYSTPNGVPSNYQATPNVTYTYDDPAIANSKGKLTNVSTSVSATEYTAFDILGRVTAHKQTTDGVSYQMAYVYNFSGALVEETYPSGRVVKNVLDNEGDLSMVQSKKNSVSGYWNYAQNFTYTAAGAVSSMQLGNGRWESTQFNSRLQPTQIALGATQNGTDLLKLDYSYGTTNNNGNVLTQQITVPTVGLNTGFTATQTYTYDSLNRISQATENITGVTPPSWKQTFTYDRYGNRNFDEANTTTLTKACGSSPNFTVCAADRKVENPEILASDNRIKEDQDGDSVNDYVFDSSGNTTKDVQSRKFTYDAENKQIKVETVDGSGNPIAIIGEYTYDGDGKRIKKHVPATGETTIFVYDASGKLAAEYSTTLNPTQQVSYLTNDHLGSPRINIDANGSIIARHDYHPFGEEIVGLGGRTAGLNYADDDVRKQFTGYERDNETDLDFAQARYYNKNHGRFNSPDEPFADQYEDDPQSWNLYIYVANNPLNFTDPSGLWKKVDCSSGQCWEAEDGDTLTSLAKIVDIPVKFLTEFFGDVNPNNIAIGHTFDLGGYDYWSVGSAMQMTSGDTPFNRNDPNLAQNIPDILQPDKPTGHPIVDGVPTFVEGAEDGLDTILSILSLRGGRGGKIPTVKNLRLSNIVRDLFKGALTKRPIGTGSTADALRYEMKTGNLVGGKSHLQKAQQYTRALEKWLEKNPTASPQDRKVAQTLLNDLKNALSGK